MVSGDPCKVGPDVAKLPEIGHAADQSPISPEARDGPSRPLGSQKRFSPDS